MSVYSLKQSDFEQVIQLTAPVGASGNLTTSATGNNIVGPVSCIGNKTIQLYAVSTSAVTSPQLLTVQISPDDTADIWIDTALTTTPSVSNGTVVMGTVLTNVCARRARVKTAAALGAGTAVAYLIVNS